MEDINNCNESYYDDNENWNDMEDINYIYILDYSDCTICEIILTKEDRTMDIEDIVEKYGCNVNTSNWMTAKNRIYGITTLNNDEQPINFV